MKQQGFGWIELVIIVAAVLVVSGLGYSMYHRSGQVDLAKPTKPVAQNQAELLDSVPTAAPEVKSVTDIEKATQTINELDLEANNNQSQQLETDAQIN